MSDDMAKVAMEAVRRHPRLAALPWKPTTTGIRIGTRGWSVARLGGGDGPGSTWIATCGADKTQPASLDACAEWLDAVLPDYLAAVRSVDPNYVQAVVEIRDSARNIEKSVNDYIALAGRLVDSARECDALRAELAAAKAHAVQQWKAGRDAAAAKVGDSARAWKDTDPNLSDALTRAALGILSLTPLEPTT